MSPQQDDEAAKADGGAMFMRGPETLGGPAPAASSNAALGYEFVPPCWAGKPAVIGDYALELIVKGEVRRRVLLDVDAKHTFVVGRARTCDVVLDGIEPRASRFHCIIQCKLACPEFYIYDLGSSHGTTLNGARIPPRTFEPMRVGEQIRFIADKSGPSTCLAVLCGPEEVMAEETAIDLAEFREKAAQERKEKERAEAEDLRRRKDAKRQQHYREAKQKAIATALAARAQQKMEAWKEAKEKDQQKLHEVTWGMAADAVEPASDLAEDVQKLMDANGQLDLEKVRKLTLTERQEGLVTKLDQKQRKLANLSREQSRKQGKATSNARQEMEDGEDAFEDRATDSGTATLEQLQRITDKIEKVEEELSQMTDNLLLSLGMKRSGVDEQARLRRTQMYETHLQDEDDEFFDRTVRKTGMPSPNIAENSDASELIGLPSLDKIENLTSLESKAALLKAERARITAQLVLEEAKQNKRAGDSQANGGEGDSLDKFMGTTIDELRTDRREQLQRRLAAVDARIAAAAKMLRVARRNTDVPSTSSAALKAPMPGGVAENSLAKHARAASLDVCTGQQGYDEVEDAICTKATGIEAGDGSARAKKTGECSMKPAGGESARAALKLERLVAAAYPVGGAPVSNTPSSGSSVVPHKRRGPERPSAALLAEAALSLVPERAPSSNATASASSSGGVDCDDTGSGVVATPRAKRGPERPSAAQLAEAAAKPAMPPPLAPTRRSRGTALATPSTPLSASIRGHVDPEKAGLQLLAPQKRPVGAAPLMPAPAPKVRKTETLALQAIARDQDMTASGEFGEPEG